MNGDARRRYRTMMFDSARWDGFRFRPDDILISTPPKCGTTWTQMICALLVFQTATFDRPLDEISPWLDMLTRDLPSVLADLDAQEHRRFVKSHTPYDGLPHDPRVTYICVARDPRDVYRSWDNHLDNTDVPALFAARDRAVGLDDIMDELAQGPPERAETELERFWACVDDDTPVDETHSLAATLHHLQTFWAVRAQPNVVLVHYDDLQLDLEGEMRKLAGRLGIHVAEGLWPELAAAAGFEQMRSRADALAPEAPKAIWSDTQRFFNRGSSGQWRELLTPADVEHYEARVAQLATPELAAWVHGGAAARGDQG